MDLVEILKGHEGCELWSPICGKCILKSVDIVRGTINVAHGNNKGEFCFNFNGKVSHGGKFYSDGETLIFPSENQRDWSRFGIKIKEGDPVMVSNKGIEWVFRRYAKDRLCWEPVLNAKEEVFYWDYIVPFADFDPYDIESNKAKSI